jgi:ketosteroid isomerase-like protein
LTACEAADDDARDLLQLELDYVVRDDRAQLELLADDCIFEFPFATDRPRRIVGRAEIRRIMEPVWAAARQRHVQLRLAESTVLETSDPELVVAELVLAIDVGNNHMTLPFVQFLRARNDRIVHVREYFSTTMRADL